MNEAQFERLAECFEKVFPNLSQSQIPSATHDSVAEWDSIAQVTLFSLVGETFGIDLDFEEFEGSTSFAAILELVRAKTAHA